MGYTILAVITPNKMDSIMAVREAIGIAKGIPNAKVRLMYMYPIQSNQMETSMALDFQKGLSRESDEAFAEPVALLEKEAIPYEAYVGIGNLIHEVRIQTQLGRCQLLVLTNRQAKLLAGPSKELKEKLTCPVLFA